MPTETIDDVLKELRIRNSYGVTPETMKTIEVLAESLRAVASGSEFVATQDRLGACASILTSLVNSYNTSFEV